jgi:vacuolar-type H+-ATPase subunit H
VQTLLDSFKAVLETERKAEKIIEAAREKAERIRNSAEEKADEVYSKTYQDTINEAKRKSVELKEQAKKDATSKAQVFIKRAKKLKKKINVSAEENFNEAVDSILNEILS